MLQDFLRRFKKLSIINYVKVKSYLIENLSLVELYYLNDIWIEEGYTGQLPEQVSLLKKIIKDYKVENVLEIGFNAGVSSDLFLSVTSLDVVSFDIGLHAYHKFGKSYIDKKFPNRHNLILGDSKYTIPEYIVSNPRKKFDLIFIDGGHDLETAESDLLNCKDLSHNDTIVIMDDTVYEKTMELEWNLGPTNAWLKAMDKKLINGISSIHFYKGRGMSWGKYS